MLFTKSEIEDKRQKIASRKWFITVFLYLILIPMLIYNIFMISQTIIKPQNTPSILGYKSFTIISGSMQPAINLGDMIVLKSVDENEIKNGDIISFKKGDSIITHRVIEIDFDENGEKQFITKGDYNNSKDIGIVKYPEIEGKIIKTIPYVGKLALAMQDKTSVVVVISIFIVYLLFRLKKERKAELRNSKRLAYSKKKMA